MRQCQNSEEEIRDWVVRTPGGLPGFTDLSQKRSYQLSLEYEISFERSISIHEPRTLDESYYIGLETDELSERNKTQVVSQKSKKKHKDQPMLMVSQLWLWSVDNFCIMALPAESLGEGFYLTLKQQFDAMSQAAKEDINGLLLAAIIMSICINSIERPYNAGLEQSLFTLFEKEIAAVSEEVRRYMDKGMETIHIEREREFIFNIHDVRDELAMIRDVVSQQEEVWNAFWEESVDEIRRDINEFNTGRGRAVEIPRPPQHGKQRRRSTSSSASGSDKSSNSDECDQNDLSGGKAAARAELSAIIGRPNTQLPRIKERIRKLDEDAERVEKWILVQLDLKSKHASLKASQAALDESHNSTMLGTAVIGFTIITIIFAPLSFLTSLFALPVDRFQQHQQNNAYPWGYIGTWLSKSNRD
jgi:Mg2+ and Co2+ transporter CorA